jgi:hypothetical protein
MRAEISYDLIMDENMAFVEGTYRLPGGTWQVFIFSRAPVAQPQWRSTAWQSGVSGVFIQFPESEQLNKRAVEQFLSGVLGVEEWVEARGPDSLQLR